MNTPPERETKSQGSLQEPTQVSEKAFGYSMFFLLMSPTILVLIYSMVWTSERARFFALLVLATICAVVGAVIAGVTSLVAAARQANVVAVAGFFASLFQCSIAGILFIVCVKLFLSSLGGPK